MIEARMAASENLGVSDAETEEQLAVQLHDVGPRVAPLVENEGDGGDQHHQFKKEAHGDGQPFAPVPVETEIVKPGAHSGRLLAHALGEAVDPEEKEIDQGQDRAGHDELLRDEAGQGDVAGQRRDDDADRDDPHRRAQKAEPLKRRHPIDAAILERRFQNRGQERRDDNVRRHGERQSEREGRLHDARDRVEEGRHAVHENERKHQCRDARRRPVRHGQEPPSRGARGKHRRHQRLHDGDDGQRPAQSIEQPVHVIGKRFDLIRRVEQKDGRRDQRRRPQQDDARGRRSPLPEGRLIRIGPRAKLGHAAPGEDAERKRKRGRHGGQVHQLLLLVANVVPPVLHDNSEPARGKAGVIAHVDIGLGGVNARRRLEKARCEHLPADILDRAQLLFDAKTRGVERASRRCQQSEMIIQLGAELRGLLGLRRLVRRRDGGKLLNLIRDGVQRRLKLRLELVALVAQFQKIVAKAIEGCVGVFRLSQRLVDLVEARLPSLELCVDVDVFADAFVCELVDRGFIDLRREGFRGLGGRRSGIGRLGRLRRLGRGALGDRAPVHERNDRQRRERARPIAQNHGVAPVRKLNDCCVY